MGEISVIIVSWNAVGHLRNCLASIRATDRGSVKEVIVVDNASSDGSADMVVKEFPEVVLIRSDQNLGFAKANNLGIRHASGSLLALVNSDVIVHEQCFQQLESFMREHQDVGLLGPKVFGADGQIQHTCGELPTVWNTLCRFLALDRIFAGVPVFSGFQMRHWNYGAQAEVGVLSGCFWMARRRAVDQVGGLDESFFFYAEDMDWCKRFADARWKVMFMPTATATHFGGGSSSQASLRYCIENLKGNLQYWQKHHGGWGRFVCFTLAVLRHCMRFTTRALLKVVGFSRAVEDQQKMKEDIVCLRWLLTGRGV